MDLERATDERLLTQKHPRVAGDAFAVLYARHEAGVHAYFVRRTGSPHDAADLAATTFLEALRSRRRFRDRGPGSATAWIYGIAHHVLLREQRRAAAEHRRLARVASSETPTPGSEQLDQISALSNDSELVALLNELPPEQRDAVQAYVLGEESYLAIARRADVSQAAARKRVSRGLKSLRAKVKEDA